jgi:hypothetical protein
MKTFFARLAVSLSQPSAWRGAFYVATAIGLSVRPDLQEAIVAAGLAAAGLIGVLVPDAVPPAE